MLKRQRPATPPPASLGDLPSLLPDGPVRPLQPLHATDTPQPCPKRQRTQPPPLDGALRGWLASESAGQHWESDCEEDWIEDTHTELGSPLPPSMATSQYKDANILLHELHVLNQHRLLFAHSPRDRPPNPSARVPPPTVYSYAQDRTGQSALWIDESSYHSVLPQFTRDGPADQNCYVDSLEDKGLVGEVQCVRQRYEDTNRFLGSLFLSRRREVKGMTSPTDSGPADDV